MKKYFCIIFFIITYPSLAQKQDVQKVIETFFEGFHKRDTLVLQSTCSDKIILQSITESAIKGNKLSSESPKEFFRSIAKIPANLKFFEKIISYNIQIDGSMAHVWTPYEFYINDKLSHSGVNTFTLFREKDNWKIIYLIDTRRK
ncbi:nuclear transport factor 2 family protein [Flavobacterium foetidum]|uniref:nuclear transport factor 2 family protein n=1 Tax=Flavobacterium foetidum TaxID=2026681 RepID=UPI0010754C49|nr:nuclear transport factor 2 family protein [Flavobacterium foetidum]KAF2513970.1 nuclear transport factor 2 family protein [Flavobacterium foetidum]